MGKRRRNSMSLREAKKRARSEGVPWMTFVRRHGLEKLEEGVRIRCRNEREKRSATPETKKGNPKEIPTPMGGQPGWKRKRRYK